MVKNVEDNKRIIETQEKERQRIARELHDYSLQDLTHLIHKIELASMYIDKDTIRAKLELETVNNSLRDIIQEIRNIIFDLRPMSFDDLGFREAVDRLKSKLENLSDMKIIFLIDKINSKDSLLLISVFRIIQECTFNAIKHSQGKILNVSVKCRDDKIFISVKDDGKGFDAEAISKSNSHFGLSIIQERVLLLFGDIKIESDSNGTEVRIWIPLTDDERE